MSLTLSLTNKSVLWRNKITDRPLCRSPRNEFWYLCYYKYLLLLLLATFRRLLYLHVSNRPRSKYQYSNTAPRLSGQNRNFLKFLLSLNSQKRLEYKESNTKYRSLTRKPPGHVKILIYRTWPIIADCILQWQDPLFLFCYGNHCKLTIVSCITFSISYTLNILTPISKRTQGDVPTTQHFNVERQTCSIRCLKATNTSR